MAIDPTIPLNVNAPQQPNPLAMASQLQQFQSNALAIQSARRDMAAKTALGAITQAAINSDGSLDPTRLMTGIKANPDAAWAASQGVEQAQKLTGNQYGLNAGALAQMNNRINAVGGSLSSLLSNQNLTSRDVINAVASRANAGLPVSEFVSSVLPSMPTQSVGEDPSAYSGRLRSWVAGVAGSAGGPELGIRTVTPSVGTMDTGGAVSTYDTNAITNPRATSISVPRTMTPEGAATPVSGPVGPQGQATQVSRAAFANSQGLGNLVPGGSPFGDGRGGGLPAALLNPNRPGGAPSSASAPPSGVAASSTAPAGGMGALGAVPGSGSAPGTAGGAPTPMVTGLGAGQTAGLAAAGKASADQWSTLQQQVGGTAAGGGSAGRIYQLQSALGDLQQLGQNGTGASAGTLNTIKSYLNSVPGVGTVIPGFDPSTIASYDQANKYLTAYASARAGAHGGTTDSQLATTLAGNANVHISNLAAQDVVKANIGLERMDQAQAQAFQSARDPTTGQPLSPDQFSNWSANWNRTMDPRAFIVDQLSPQQVQKSLAGMTPPERSKFQGTYNTAVANGWVSPPAWAAPSASAPAAPAGGQPSAADMAIYPTGQGN